MTGPGGARLIAKPQHEIANHPCHYYRSRSDVEHVCFPLLALALVFAFTVDFVLGRFQPSPGNTGGTPRSKIHKATRTYFVHLIMARLEHGICSKTCTSRSQTSKALVSLKLCASFALCPGACRRHVLWPPLTQFHAATQQFFLFLLRSCWA